MQTQNPIVQICQGQRCKDYGGSLLLTSLQIQGVTAHAMTCQSLCNYSPVAKIDEICMLKASMHRILATQKE